MNISCDNTANITSWKACRIRALDQELRQISKNIKLASLTLMVIGIVSSSLVCNVIMRVRRRASQRKISNALILNLAIADIIFRIVYIVTRLIIPAIHVDVTALGCKIMLFSHYACAAVTFALLAGMAIDRYQQILHPLKYFCLSKTYRLVLIIAPWLSAIFVALGFVYIGEDKPYESSDYVPKRFRECNGTIPEKITHKTKYYKYCTLAKNSSYSQLAFTPYFILAFCIPLVIIIVTYSAVFRFLKARSKHRFNQVTVKSKRKALKMLIVVVASFVVCWAPIMLVDLFRVYGNTVLRLRMLVRQIAECFSHSSSIICPVIYAFGNPDFRKELGKMIKNTRTACATLPNKCTSMKCCARKLNKTEVELAVIRRHSSSEQCFLSGSANRKTELGKLSQTIQNCIKVP